MHGVYTNTAPVDAYRGAGRPEAVYVIERLMDWSARELGLDPIELRRRNFIPPEQIPLPQRVGRALDVGDFARVLDRAVRRPTGPASRRGAEAERGAGRLRGIGLCYYIESILGGPREDAASSSPPDGTVELSVGTQSNGQGHETAYAQFLHEQLASPSSRCASSRATPT